MMCVESMTDSDVKHILSKNTIEKLSNTVGLCTCRGCKEKLQRLMLERAIESCRMRV